MSKQPDENSKISLRQITAETVRAICKLHVSTYQEQFVAPNAVSIAQAYFCREAWFRAIYADDTPVGFAMIYQVLDKGEYHLWRFMIDEKYQKMGFGGRALQLVIEHVRPLPFADELTLTYHKAVSCPQPFYEKLGFRDTGKMIDDEHEMVLKF